MVDYYYISNETFDVKKKPTQLVMSDVRKKRKKSGMKKKSHSLTFRFCKNSKFDNTITM